MLRREWPPGFGLVVQVTTGECVTKLNRNLWPGVGVFEVCRYQWGDGLLCFGDLMSNSDIVGAWWVEVCTQVVVFVLDGYFDGPGGASDGALHVMH